ncbi:MAG TPA: response regulator [Propionibacteriaceae bacterium]|nr:response regulator [Propionibacteriaceae bacterium]
MMTIAWWQLALVANTVISVAYVCISLLIVIPTARAKQLWTNKLALATSLIFFSCSVGHGIHAAQPIAAVANGDTAALKHMNTWWLATWDTFTAIIAVYYLTLRRLYGRLLTSAPLFHDLEEQQRLADLEDLAALSAARREAESQRDAHASMLQAVIQNSQSMIYVKDLEGRYLLTNGLLERHFGLEEGSLVGKTDEAIDPETAPVWRANDQRALDGLYELEEWNDGPDGRHYYETAKFPLRDADGVVYATCGISLDVTERRRAAAQMIERDAALAATAAKSAFLATMSHEIRTPMNAVIGMTDLLRNTELDDDQREYVETVRTSGDALMALINDILDFSKIESGELELEAVAFDLRAEAESSLDLVSAAATRKGLELVCDVDPDCPPRVVGDVHRIRQILANLLSNAVKFTEQGEVVLTISTKLGQGDDVHVQASVRDTGIGIPAQHVDRLFKTFSQVDASTTRVHGGTGLGLAISRRLAEAMGGDLTLAATSPEGSTFTFDVVLGTTPPDEEEVNEEEAVAIAQLVGKRVLVVDDNATNRRIVDLQLTGLGMVVSTFSNPRVALEQVHAGLTYDAAVLDMHMPEMDGVMLAAELKKSRSSREAPLVLLTSLGWKPPNLADSFTAFLTKPAKRVVLQETLIGVLHGRQVNMAQGHRVPTPAAQPLRVLLAEDNMVNQRVAKLMLKTLGHRVDTVVNGADAVEAATSRPYDVILMDVQMPRMDGLEATRRIRGQLPDPTQPCIIAMTANALSQDRDACLAAGMQSYLSKPVRLEELEAVLNGTASNDTPSNDTPPDDRPAGSPVSSPATSPATSPAPAVESAIDDRVLETLLTQMSSDPLGQQEIIDQYLAEAGQQVVVLMDLLRSGDLGQMKAVAHTWRSTSALLGARRLAKLLHALEQAADERPAECRDLAHQVETEFGEVKQSLNRRIAVALA